MAEGERIGGDAARDAAIAGRTVDLSTVEQVLLSHPAVLEASVSPGEADGLRATVTLKGGYVASNDLKAELGWYVGSDMGFPSVFEDIELRARSTDGAGPEVEDRLEGDVIYTSGHRIDLSEVERVLESNENVVRAVVTGVPDTRRGEILRAWVTLRSASVPTDDLKRELAWYTQVEIGPMVRFQDIEFGDAPSRMAGEGGGIEGLVVVDDVSDEDGAVHVAGHRISTTEVTRVLLSHPDIADAAVVTVPDEERGEVLRAFAKVREGVVPSNDLKLELAWLVLTELRPVGFFRSIELDGPPSELPAPANDGVGEMVSISGHTHLSLDVEEALERHKAVVEAVVIGVPDEVHGEALQAFVNLVPGVVPTEDLREELAWHARSEVGPEVVFRSIRFRRFLPGAKDRRTLRRILRADALEIPTKMSISIAD